MKNILSISVIIISIATFVLFVKPIYTETNALESKKTEFKQVLDNSKKLQTL